MRLGKTKPSRNFEEAPYDAEADFANRRRTSKPRIIENDYLRGKPLTPMDKQFLDMVKNKRKRKDFEWIEP